MGRSVFGLGGYDFMRGFAKSCAAACILAAAGCQAPMALAQAADEGETPEFEISGNVGLVSDYRFRGISYSDRDPAIQGGIDISHKSGFFVGTWASSVSDYGGSSVELDLYGGYAGSVAGFDYTATFLGYVYPGGTDTNYYELKGTVSRTIGPAAIGLQLAWVPDQHNYPGDNVYMGASVDVGIPDTPVSLRAAIGRETGGYDEKWDWELTASYAVGGPLTASVSYIDTNYSGINEAGRNANGGVVFSLLAEF